MDEHLKHKESRSDSYSTIFVVVVFLLSFMSKAQGVDVEQHQRYITAPLVLNLTLDPFLSFRIGSLDSDQGCFLFPVQEFNVVDPILELFSLDFQGLGKKNPRIELRRNIFDRLECLNCEGCEYPLITKNFKEVYIYASSPGSREQRIARTELKLDLIMTDYPVLNGGMYYDKDIVVVDDKKWWVTTCNSDELSDNPPPHNKYNVISVTNNTGMEILSKSEGFSEDEFKNNFCPLLKKWLARDSNESKLLSTYTYLDKELASINQTLSQSMIKLHDINE